MKGFLKSKLVLSLAALVMIAALVFVPLSGTITRSHAQGLTSTPFSTTFTSADCASPVTVVSLHAGDKVSGTDTLTSSDPSEASQGEDLLLKETNGPFTQTITVNSGSKSFSFTAAANNDSLTACITGEVDTDQTATISGTVTSVTPPPPPVVRKAPYDFTRALSGLVDCNSSNTSGTGEARVGSDIHTGHLLVALRARSLAGAAVGHAGVGIKYTAPVSGTITIDTRVMVAGFDALALISVPKLGKTGIVSIQSSVEIHVTRISPRRDNVSTTDFAHRIITPLPSGIIPHPLSLVVYKPPKTFSGSLKLNVLAGDQLFICVGIKSKVVAVGLIPFISFAVAGYGKVAFGDTRVQEVRIAYV